VREGLIYIDDRTAKTDESNKTKSGRKEEVNTTYDVTGIFET